MYHRILVPVDGSPTSQRGVETAIEMARLTGACVRLVHVLDELVFPIGFDTGASYLRDVLPRLRRKGERLLADAQARVAAAGIAVDSLLSECFATRISDVVLDQAKEWGADLIVLGTHGRRGWNRLFMGSDAEQVVRGAEVPVLLVRSDGDRGTPRTQAAPATERVATPSLQA
jgi:nucleotide-binding universal stress UspA family protein